VNGTSLIMKAKFVLV